MIFGILLALAASTAPAEARSLTAELAHLSTSVCLPVASGELTLPSPADAAASGKRLSALGLKPGIDNSILDAMGPASGILNRSTMAHVKRGTGWVVMAADGPMPGCRLILVGERGDGSADEVAAALVTKEGGWRAVPGAPQAQGPATRRMFLRRTAAGKPILLNLVELSGMPGKVRMFTTAVEVPPGVTLPPGF